MFKWLKGMLAGLLIGAAAGLSVTPHTRKRIMRLLPCRKLKCICRSIEDML